MAPSVSQEAAAQSTVSSVSLDPATIAGGASTTGTVTLSAAAPSGGTTVTLASSSPSATVPSSVTVADGATTATFTVTTSSVASNTSATITASGADGNSQTAALTITPATLRSVTLSPASVTGTGSSTANRVYLHGNAYSSAVVQLASSDPSVASVQSSVTIAAGSSSHVFAIDTFNVTSTQTVTITATYNGASESATLTVNPAPVALTSVTLSPKSLTGGDTSKCAVTLTAEPSKSVTVALSSSNPQISVPSSVAVGTSETTHSFIITAPNSVSSKITATITATYNGVSKTAILTVAPETVGSVTLSPTSLEGGQNSSSNTVALASAATVTTKIQLTSSNKNVSVQSPVTVDVGSTSQTFAILYQRCAIRADGDDYGYLQWNYADGNPDDYTAFGQAAIRRADAFHRSGRPDHRAQPRYLHSGGAGESHRHPQQQQPCYSQCAGQNYGSRGHVVAHPGHHYEQRHVYADGGNYRYVQRRDSVRYPNDYATHQPQLNKRRY